MNPRPAEGVSSCIRKLLPNHELPAALVVGTDKSYIKNNSFNVVSHRRRPTPNIQRICEGSRWRVGPRSVTALAIRFPEYYNRIQTIDYRVYVSG